jgi:hypothetical protein
MDKVIETKDPFNQYPHLDVEEHCGLIALWARHGGSGVDFYTLFDDNYQWGLTESTGGVVDDYGLYEYPEDPPLHPFMSFTTEDEVCYIYPYGITAIVNRANGQQFITRMD